MICYTNAIAFSNDIAEIVRLFEPKAEIEFMEKNTQETSEQIEDGFQVLLTANMAYVSNSSAHFTENIEPAQEPLEKKRNEKGALKRAVFHLMRQQYPDKNLPWGALTGVRPTRLLRDTIHRYDEQQALDIFRKQFFVQEDKIHLLQKVAQQQKKLLAQCHSNEFDLYIGIPFCTTKCTYCSFGSYEMGKPLAKPEDVEIYLHTLTQEIEENLSMAYALGYQLRAVYIGGGTPTSLHEHQIETLLAACQKNFPKRPVEWTVEAGRPDTLTSEKLAVLKQFEVSRISINPQTIHDDTLRKIGRSHTNQEFLQAYEMARFAGFDCINTDVIIGLPDETADMVAETMETIANLKPENITVHTLAIKRSAELKYTSESYKLADDSEARRMLAISATTADSLGMLPYYLYRQKYMSGSLENIGYAYPGTESLYNVGIMEEVQNILALGAGGISKWIFQDENYLKRVPNPKDIPTYIAKQDILKQERFDCMKRALC